MLVDARSHPRIVGPHPACTSHHHTCNLDHGAPTCHTVCCNCNQDHVTPIHCVVAPAIRTTSSPYVVSSQLQTGPTPTCMLLRRTCNLDLVPPIHCAVASAIRTDSHLSDVLSNRQSGPRPSDALYCHTCRPAHVPPTPHYRRTCNPPCRSASTSLQRRATSPSSLWSWRGSFLP